MNEALDFIEANPERVVKEVRQRFNDSSTVEVVLWVVK